MQDRIRGLSGSIIVFITTLLFGCNGNSNDNNNTSALESLRTSFTDEALFNCLLEQASANNWSQPAHVDELICTNKGITSLSGIHTLPEIELLNLSVNDISDLTPLQSLNKLVNLNLESNGKILDFIPLSSMTQLQVLNLRRTDIPDLSVLMTLVNLQDLNLKENELNDTSGTAIIANLVNLEVLIADLNDINNVSFLTTPLTKLTYLSFIGNKITDASAIGNQSSLVTLNLNNNQIETGLAALHTLSGLTLLDLRNNRVDSTPTLPCADVTALITALGASVVNLDNDTSDMDDTAVPNVNCTDI